MKAQCLSTEYARYLVCLAVSFCIGCVLTFGRSWYRFAETLSSERYDGEPNFGAETWQKRQGVSHGQGVEFHVFTGEWAFLDGRADAQGGMNYRKSLRGCAIRFT
jgi:hypothetical protein